MKHYHKCTAPFKTKKKKTSTVMKKKKKVSVLTISLITFRYIGINESVCLKESLGEKSCTQSLNVKNFLQN